MIKEKMILEHVIVELKLVKDMVYFVMIHSGKFYESLHTGGENMQNMRCCILGKPQSSNHPFNLTIKDWDMKTNRMFKFHELFQAS